LIVFLRSLQLPSNDDKLLNKRVSKKRRASDRSKKAMKTPKSDWMSYLH